MAKGHESMLERTEMHIGRWMCGTSLREKKSSAELKDRMGIEALGSVLKRNRLSWFGHVERKDKEDWVRKYMYMEVEGARSRGRPRKTWLEVVRNDEGIGSEKCRCSEPSCLEKEDCRGHVLTQALCGAPLGFFSGFFSGH